MLETLSSGKLFERYIDEGDINVFVNSESIITHTSTDNVFSTVKPLIIKRGETCELNPEVNVVVKESLKRLMKQGKYYVITFKESMSKFESPTGTIEYHPSTIKVIKKQSIINKLKSVEEESIEEFDEDLNI